MRLSFVADYRSPLARQWIDWLADAGHQVHVVSSSPPGLQVDDYPVEFIPLGPQAIAQAFLQRRNVDTSARFDPTPRAVSVDGPMAPVRQAVIRYLGPASLRPYLAKLGRSLAQFRPDVVHAMRLPFEAMAVMNMRPRVARPVVASIWGNDLTLHASSSPVLGRASRRALARADALHTDCFRDRTLAAEWGFDLRKPTLVIPSSGGVRSTEFRPGGNSLRPALGIPPDATVLLNARGIREYVDVAAFFSATSAVLRERSDVHVVCTGMRGDPRAEAFAGGPDGDRIHLLGSITHREMPDLYRTADISVSLTTHDGTPNTLLEAMACGCFPVVGPVESVLEWITDGANGLVAGASDVPAITSTLLTALGDAALRDRARPLNIRRIHDSADLDACMNRAVSFYELLHETHAGRSNS